MAKIKALKPEVYNLIAAGEVVENPMGAIKELVENSIDAAARRIVIDVVGGGYEQLTVTDNGCGIREEDVELAFAKYATSKLETAEDLVAIQTLGFRGEALSSIAAVSRVKLTTRTADSDTGVCVTVENGVITDKQYVPANVGTKIEVRDLYYNTPVRKKFLKSPAHEVAEISKFVAKLILTNPNLEIIYHVNGKTEYESKGNSLEEAIFAIYGANCLSKCLRVSYALADLRITGYVGTPDYSKANRNYQTLSVNGRCVADSSISGAILQAYKSRLMTHKFPFYVLNLEVPCDTVNVNVHPKKSEVRFENPRYVCGAFFHAVDNVLNEYDLQRSEEIFTVSSKKEAEMPIPKIKEKDYLATFNKAFEEGIVGIMNSGQKEDVLKIEQATQTVDNQRDFDEYLEKIEREVSVAKARAAIGLDSPTAVKQATLTIEPSEPKPTPIEIDEDDSLLDRVRILGVAFKTYLILELDDKIIFVDQHAAHERILFDKFLEGASQDMQPLMIPYVFTVKDDEAAFIEENVENILSAGIEIQQFGHNTYRITAVSSLLVGTKMEDFVQFLLSSIDDFKLDDRTLIVETIAKRACKAAVKAGETLNEYEIKCILKEVCDNKILQCPHGRPITVVYTKTQFEKLFKRIA